ncbi:MAG: carboxypeptidase-like regulatory domain-containing protein [Gemmataceae bacterium]
MSRPFIAVILLLGPLVAREASAHALGAECKLHGDRVELEAYFSDNTPAQEAKVVVYDKDRAALQNGTTDGEGRWSFAAPAAGDYEIVVDAGAGHRATVKLIVPATSAAAVSSSGPSRAEFTRTPWLQIVAGVALIAFPATALYFWLRKSRPLLERKS